MRNNNCFFWLKPLSILLGGLLLTACAHNGSMSANNPHGKGMSSSACMGNSYLQKYGCSMRRIENAAQSGDPDAQYALGYMYYYGIGTPKNKQSAKVWIGRAAQQGQPLAKRAENLMQGGQGLHSLHPRHHDQNQNQNQSQYNTARSGQGDSDSSYRRDAGRRATQYTPTPSVDELNTATPNKPIKQVLPNYGGQQKSQQSQQQSESVIKSLRRKDTPPAQDATPGNSKPKVEPITRLHDPRLQPNARPNGYAKTMTARRFARASMTATERQMMMTPRRNFTLQLMSGRNLSAIKTFVRQHNLEGRAHFYSTQMNGRPWYMLVYGTYSNAEMAQMAAKQLPPSLRTLRPWVKSYRIVQDEIRLRRIVT